MSGPGPGARDRQDTASDSSAAHGGEASARAATRPRPRRASQPALRAFRRPRLWLTIGAAMLAAVVVGSLLPARGLPPVPFDGFDKLQHLLGYAALSAYAVMLFARLRTQALCAAGLVALGIGLELAQASLTSSREADVGDALFNALGVLGGLSVATTPLATALQRLDARWQAGN